MKNLLIVFALVTLISCQKRRYPLRDEKRKQFRKEIVDCILNNEKSSEELKNRIKTEKKRRLQKNTSFIYCKIKSRRP